MFGILTFAISIVDILTFWHYDFDIVTVDIFIVDILTVYQLEVYIQLSSSTTTTTSSSSSSWCCCSCSHCKNKKFSMHQWYIG